ncbi:MAG: 3-methyl-2-oxobutanoate hydroxymethyltransferase [Thermoanaerobaculales bacterium]|jgi:3-methyl-2-oxobutanoate hydroxymethyltransferase|nr:3-methyl-2-oxobutanoate hydroxymethyltransferase [Thermoanaerobaculales bacterium]
MIVQDFARRKREGVPISMVTCYDSWSAALIAATDIDCVLVGDSLAMVVYGHPNTLPADVATMAAHTAAVRRGAPQLFVVGDLPFLSYRKGLEAAVEAAGALMRAGANAVKLEGAAGNLELVRHLVESGVPVMGHLGLTPQSVNLLGGFKVQGRGEAAAAALLSQARELAAAGCFALVLEAVPAELAAAVTAELAIPTIGIGAGARVDGQVLVLQDLLGITTAFRPKFVRTWLDGSGLIRDALQAYHRDVTSRAFPNGEESYR